MPYLIFAIVLMFMPMVAYADSIYETEDLKVELALADDSMDADAVLTLSLADGWHSYGDPPGDSGLAPRFNWEGSENVEGVDVNLPPTVEKVELDLFKVNAYEGDVAMPLHVKREDENAVVSLKLNYQFMVCNEICIPESAQLMLDIPAQDTDAAL